MSHTFSCKSVNKLSSPQKVHKTPVCGKCQTPLALHERTTEVDNTGFEKLMNKSDKPLVIDFWASWCGPCQMYGPEFVKTSAQFDKAVFLKVNTETQQQLAARYGVRGIPCTIVVHQGKEIARQSGAMNSAQLTQWLNQVLS
jgi:thioredoxin 2